MGSNFSSKRSKVTLMKLLDYQEIIDCDKKKSAMNGPADDLPLNETFEEQAEIYSEDTLKRGKKNPK